MAAKNSIRWQIGKVLMIFGLALSFVSLAGIAVYVEVLGSPSGGVLFFLCWPYLALVGLIMAVVGFLLFVIRGKAGGAYE